jgi:hypothetical protein
MLVDVGKEGKKARERWHAINSVKRFRFGKFQALKRWYSFMNFLWQYYVELRVIISKYGK